MGRNMSGRKGEDLTLKLPPGTLIYDEETGVLLKDLDRVGEQACLAQGGKGGRGNARFAAPDHQTPREFEPGTPGEQRKLRLELKLIAEVGLVGLPNAGKSTLLARLSKARPRIADYPFTTLTPQLGIVELSDERRLVLADIPGLIEGAHSGAGLGDAFLKHIERTRVIIHLVDVGTSYSAQTPLEAYQTIRGELSRYSETLAQKEEIVAANKIDLTGGQAAAQELRAALDRPVFAISAVSGKGLAPMLEAVWSLLQRVRAPVEEPEEHTLPPPPHLEAP